MTVLSLHYVPDPIQLPRSGCLEHWSHIFVDHLCRQWNWHVFELHAQLGILRRGQGPFDVSFIKPGNLVQSGRQPDSSLECDHGLRHCQTQIAPLKILHPAIPITGFQVDSRDQTKRRFDRRSKEDCILGIQHAAGTPMAENIYQREAGEMSAVGAAQHDSVGSRIGSETQRLTGFSIPWLCQGCRQMLQD